MPSQIVVAFVAEITVYGFPHCEQPFAELLKILENPGATVPASSSQALRIGVIELAKDKEDLLTLLAV